jgi:hypothetical protein
MSNVLRLAIVDPSDSSRSQLKNMLLGMDIVWLEAECSRYEFFADVVGQADEIVSSFTGLQRQAPLHGSSPPDGSAEVSMVEVSMVFDDQHANRQPITRIVAARTFLRCLGCLMVPARVPAGSTGER